MAPDLSTVTTEAKSQLSTASKYGGKMIFNLELYAQPNYSLRGEGTLKIFSEIKFLENLSPMLAQ